MTPAEADVFVDQAAAYVHMPFCRSICPYCDFAVVAGRDDEMARYSRAVEKEITTSRAWRPLDAVYFGGGTPSHVPAESLGSIVATLSAHHGLTDQAEVSLEANPEDFDPATAGRLLDAGFNRVSFGVQSFDGAVLGSLGRAHDAAQVERAVKAARLAGFENISIDLIYGTPGETDESWRQSLDRGVDLGVDHMSAYALTVERGTPLGRAVASGAAAPDPDVQADRYEIADRVLEKAGLERYEVSNWSRPGMECRYNLTVWAQGEFEAYGNGAHGYREGRRFRNHRRLDAYLSRIEGGESPRAGEDVVSGWDAELDRLFVGLRRSVGVASGPGTDALLQSDSGQRLVDAGAIAYDGERMTVLRPLLTDAVHRSVLEQTAPIVVGDGNA